MQEKILNLIKEVDIIDICQFHNLADAKALSEIVVKDNKISFAVDIGVLKIDSKTGEILAKKIKEKLKTLGDFQVNIILTSSQPEQQSKPQIKTTSVKGVKNIIAVASGKGGVGKSTVAANLAISLKRIGFKTALVDADIYGPSIAYLMNLKGKPESEGGLMIPINSYGIDCISVGSLVESEKATVWRGPMVTKVLTQLISGTKWNDIDYMIIDLPPGTGDVHLSLIQQFRPNGVVLVSTPQNLAIIDVIKAVDMFKTLEIPICGVIQNMAYLSGSNGEKNYIFGKDLAKKMADDLGLNFLGDVPISPEINQANDSQNPICNQNPSHSIAFEFGKIVENILDSLV
ncbi:MAG: antiporter inner rane protein [Rickettsiaceae bacterium]|nr:antiporter inner rane protein [Rickettsiaceae bacterium]